MTPPPGHRDTSGRKLAELHERLAPDLLRYLERRLPTVEDAADVLADTFLAAWRHVNRMPADDEHARMWMFVTARNAANNWRRGHQRRTDLTLLLRNELTRASHVTTPTTPEALDARAAVASLPTNLREIVTLVHWDGFTVPEAARIVGIRESTARGRYQRARNRLRAVLDTPNTEPHRESEPVQGNTLRRKP